MTHSLPRVSSLALVPVLLAAIASAQGSDDCATPTLIAGEGNFFFTNLAATTGPQGQNESLCNQFGSTAVQRDVWFTWTAPATGFAIVEACGSDVDTKIAAYAGSGCPTSPAIACNDDACESQSQAGFDVVGGGSYIIQIGVFPGAAGGGGPFSVAIGAPPLPCGAGTGPDVTVGDILGVLNTNPVAGIDAIALGTTACNIGTAPLNWFFDTNDHPVIRQNLYRYKVVGGAGRFEQVGMSWLKHGFGAVEGSLCCPCASIGDSQHLGVGCSDTYVAAFNGAQSGLGPNWQVDAHTGVFAYPPANPSHGNDSIYRRCQVALSDLAVTGGASTTRFFGECQYVAKDDAAAGNGNNNASWREASVSGTPTDYSVSLLGTTTRGDPAIRAWAEIDPAVVLDDVQIPGDGLVILGSRATALGGGQWRYELGVFNLNSDRNIGSVSVPVPAGVGVTNIGFHDVDYHDGDGPGNVSFSGAAWVGAHAGGAVTWACETQAVNASANAIRWGTQYNFRFDANVAPQPGSITLGVWKPGAPASVVAAGEVPGNGPVRVASFCFGDGSGAPCPCGNSGAAGRGCENSIATGGALLSASGTPSLGADDFVLTSSGERPTSLTVFWQGANETAGTTRGDGVACFNNPGLRRLYFKNASGGVASAPQGAELSVSARSAAAGDPLGVGSTRVYHAFYRDPDPIHCPAPAGNTFNTSNGLRVIWGP